jgi:hypothetical protein
MVIRQNWLCNILIVEPSGPEAPWRNKLHQHHQMSFVWTAKLAREPDLDEPGLERVLRAWRRILDCCLDTLAAKNRRTL